jgi:uncharacterized protein (UPF0210 family)
MDRPVVRTITLGVAEPHPLRAGQIEYYAGLAARAEGAFRTDGYEVQTVRLSTRPIFDDLAAWTAAEIRLYGRELQRALTEARIRACSLGPAPAARPDFPLDRLELVGDLLIGASALNCAVQLGTVEHGVRTAAARPAADLFLRLSEGSEGGLENFRFAVLACVGPLGPFFPAACHTGPAALSIGLQSVRTVAEALRGAAPDDITARVAEALRAAADPVVRLGRRLAEAYGLEFAGIDLSPAPAGDDSIAAAIEECAGGPFGSPGTLMVCAALTAAIRGTGLPTCGYNGLMLPVMEDAMLARRWAEGRLTLHELLCYSSVCGTGLDTVPIPGDTPPDEIARLLLDVAALAVRLGKPLSARLFPVPGVRAGKRTSFCSPYLVNSAARWWGP